jgi:hypothetical protein
MRRRPTGPRLPSLAAWLLPFLMPLVAHGDTLNARLEDLAERLEGTGAVAVGTFYEEVSGHESALGHRLRGRVEAALAKRGLEVVARRDLVLVMEENDTFRGPAEDELWESARAPVLVTGAYTLTPGGPLTLTVKALRTLDARVLAVARWSGPPPADAEALAAARDGNVFHRQLQQVVGGQADGGGPALSAHLNRSCYPPGAPAVVTVESEPGVHLYLLYLNADHTAMLLYPIPGVLADRPLKSAHFAFPPADLRHRDGILLHLYPLDGRPTRESVKVIASRRPLDLSFLPVPTGALYASASGADLGRVMGVLEAAEGWRAVDLPLVVGPGCGG